MAHISHADAKLVSAASAALSGLSSETIENCQMIIDEGGVARLIEIAASDNESAKTSSIATLAHLARESAHRAALKDVKDLPILSPLIKGLESDNPDLQSHSSCAIGNLCRDEDMRMALSSQEGGLAALARLVASPVPPVRQAASRVIIATGSEPYASKVLCDSGALTTLQRLEQSVGHHSEYTTLALRTLLSSNPSAKYALFGRLGVNETILPYRTGTDGERVPLPPFYDAGKLHIDRQPKSLEELASNAPNIQRPIYLINPYVSCQNTYHLPVSLDF